jgi:hypothetical protein
MHIGSAMIENIIEVDPEYAEVAEEYEEDILVIGFPEAFNNFPLSGSCPRGPVHNPYFSAIIMFVCALISFGEKDLHHVM